MTQQEMVTALITIKRGIYSKPIKRYIDSLLSKMTVQENCHKSAMSYQLVQESFTYGQKNSPSVDVEVWHDWKDTWL